ncbi:MULTISPECIES: c-type cytochrome [Pseudorhizobium]|jgi:cytochrome c553|uniref:Cytochrome c553 n=2 Tax=Pseudorhizobium TaxID=1903858 RepID=A0A7X0DFH8_9HYPH|nr:MULTISPECIES: cytochrome c [Pseudorhizobium]MBB6181174.1 cytochrome c553 [Pseudorhizobium flavum]CAD6600711.1 cytochrome c [Pseudorhizobium flavum]CAD7056672.1 cytochrome c [Pseudorhizobium halotolerans]
MRSVMLAFLGGVLLTQGTVAGAQELAGDVEAGRKKAGMCRTCHGIDGVGRIPIAPHIGGESAAYLSRQLAAFRDGTRTHEMMSVVAKGLDDQAIADLAAWYSAQQASASLPSDKNEDMAPAACVSCHGADGLATIDDAPNLAGENAIYIDTQLKAFRSGKRKHEIMSEIAAGLSDAEIRAVADWYAGTKLEVVPVK